MSKTLRVVEPFFTMDEGDTFELSEDGKSYVSAKNEEFHKHGDEKGDVNAVYTSAFTISADYAKVLVKEGFLEEIFAKDTTEQTFINIFDEIDNLIIKYNNELTNIDTSFEGEPECLKVEKITVLKNMIKLLNHLKSLKK